MPSYLSVTKNENMMKMFSIHVIVSVLLLSICACADNDSLIDGCGDAVILKDYDSGNSTDTEMRIIAMEVEGDCLSITYGSGGCDGNTWATNVYSKLAYGKTSPPQRYALFELIDTELCEAYIKKTAEFDLSTMRIEGEQSIHIVFEGYDEVLTYTY